MADIEIKVGDLNDPAIDEIINLQASLRRQEGEFIDSVKTPFYLNAMFYYGIAGFLGGFLAWLILEPFINDSDDGIPFLSDYILFGSAAASTGMMIGIAYGIVNRNVKQALYAGIVGIGVGLGITIPTTMLADILYGIAISIAYSVQGDFSHLQSENAYPFTGGAFFLHMCGRSLAWAIVSVGAGLGLGVALKAKKLILNGVAGSLIGGALGGLLFDPITRFITNGSGDAAVSRAVGVVAVGLFVGIFIGFFENTSKEAWLLMVKGPLTGKQFNVFKSPMIIGSAPKADVYLFKDSDIDPTHASISKVGSKYKLKDEGSASGTFVNGRKIDSYILQSGDVVTFGETVLKYHERSNS
ncbi:MAG: FHA domain-containing protein [Planctomycetes bacterium]|nr:FHA domain-containing protein [Planctomycetota bacterium]